MLAVPAIILAGEKRRRGVVGAVVFGAVLAALVVVISSAVQTQLTQRDPGRFVAWLRGHPGRRELVTFTLAGAALIAGLLVPAMPLPRRVLVSLIACGIAALSVWVTWGKPLQVFDYIGREARGEIRATYTLVPFSPSQRFPEADRQAPGTDLATALGVPADSRPARRTFILGTDALGQDVLSQLLSACRLSISIGLVSTGIAVLIGVTIGATMGYFGGWVDIILFRVVEIFMAVPLLFLLIVAAAVLPPELRTTYTMMMIIGCFTWTGAARFTRAEFLKLRSQDFVQSAKAVGLPLPSILFKHMLPNGVTPVLVDASFTIAAAIAIEATLSYLGLGPVDQASWGKLLSSAMNPEGQFKWWLAVFPGMAIFLTVLSYNMIGEALRDAIDPKLKKARV